MKRDAVQEGHEQPEATVFIIDDDSGIRRALERLMRSAGWEVESHSCPREFIERLPYTGVGCILLDVQMPGMTGPDLQQELLALSISLPVIYLTGHADVPMAIQAMKKGAVDILLKPFEDDVVLQTAGAAITRHRSLMARMRGATEIENRVSRLSAREREVLEYVISGRLNKQIAGDLGITEKTVKAHRARVMEKLETRSVAGLVRMCSAVGIEPHAPRIVPPAPLSMLRPAIAH
jgi:two-component system, LuxR family, response regulator FixJ